MSWFRMIHLNAWLAASTSLLAAGLALSQGQAQHWFKGLLCAAFLLLCGLASGNYGRASGST
jgi:hypothetical protein